MTKENSFDIELPLKVEHDGNVFCKLKERYGIPLCAWSRQLSATFPENKEFTVSLKNGLKMAGLGLRMYNYVKRENNAGRLPIIDPFNGPKPFPLMGVPLGGIGSGSITRGWRGDFVRWQIYPPGIVNIMPVEIDQFSVYINKGGKKVCSVLNPQKPKNSKLHNWDWNIDGTKSSYHALFPRAWTIYEEPDPDITLKCEQISPVVAHNYKESSYPVGTFIWDIENNSNEEAQVSLMFTFQNGIGSISDESGGHCNRAFRDEQKNICGVVLKHKCQRVIKIQGKDITFEDPLSFCIAAKGTEEDHVTYCTKFSSNNSESASKLWQDFADDGLLNEPNEGDLDQFEPSKKSEKIAAAVSVKIKLPAGQKKRIEFSLSWDCPRVRFNSGASYYRRYTKFLGHDDNSKTLALMALSDYPLWQQKIQEWQSKITEDDDLPLSYRAALFNELYYIVDGGTVWITETATSLDGEKPLDPEIGHFAYLESLEYLMYNTYDVHFYASFALSMCWPKLELSLQRDIAKATITAYDQSHLILHTGKKAPRKVKGAVPHDLGNPGEDPWNKVNSYCIQDIARWKDLPCKFVLQIYRDYVATKDLEFLKEMWDVVSETMEYVQQFDKDGDGVIDNEGFPDQTYDTWAVLGCSAYCGGLYLASLTVAAKMANMLGFLDKEKQFLSLLEKGKLSYNKKLWNGSYYKYDSSNSRHSDSIMADQLAGHWYLKACGLESFIPEDNAYLALKTVYDYNVKRFQNGQLGAINGMRPDGSLDTTCMQSVEVWTGTTYAVAAAMLQQGLISKAFETANGIIDSCYEKFGYMFQTPEAWDTRGNYRAFGYMRPLSIWAIQWAWEKFYSQPKEDLTLQHKLSQITVTEQEEISTKSSSSSILSIEDERLVNELLTKSSDDIICDKFQIQIKGKDLFRLKESEWLNDEIINFYLQMIIEKIESDPSSQGKIFAFNTFFFSFLSQRGYDSIKRWTKKIDIFTLEKLLVPIHESNIHWCLGIINFKEKRFEFYDGVQNRGDSFLKELRNYVQKEHENKKGSTLDLSSWRDFQPDNIPRQGNGWDCGMFLCKYAEYIAFEKKMDFTQKDMNNFRKKMMIDISRGKLSE